MTWLLSMEIEKVPNGYGKHKKTKMKVNKLDAVCVCQYYS